METMRRSISSWIILVLVLIGDLHSPGEAWTPGRTVLQRFRSEKAVLSTDLLPESTYATSNTGSLKPQSCRQRRHDLTRRSLWKTVLTSSVIGASFCSSGKALATPTATTTPGTASQEGLVSATTVADLLRCVPTFTIVDPKGVPYMVVGEDAKVTGYFFTSYDEALRILKLAKTSADKALQQGLSELRAKRKQEGLGMLSKQQELDELGVTSNPWSDARISTITLDLAVTLALKSSNKSFFQIAPSESSIQEALDLDKSGKQEMPEGKVPLFYMADFDITRDGKSISPLYFGKAQLLDEWKRNNPGTAAPPVLVTELFAVLTEMVKHGGTDEDLKKLAFVPPPESAQKAKECLKRGGKESPFQLGQRIVVL